MKDYSNCVLILDAGSQFCKLIDRVVRELSVETHVSPISMTHEEIVERKYRAIIISGGPFSTVSGIACDFDEKILKLGIPVLGICFGMQLMVKAFGGTVEQLDHRADSQTVISIIDPCDLYNGLGPDQTVLLTHGDSCTKIPESFKINAFNAANVAASISNSSTRLYGVQFHPEVNLTVNGVKIIENFLFQIANCEPTFTLASKLESCLTEIKSSVKPDSIIITLVSGGVDSTVCATLVHKALPLHAKHFFIIDHGFLRENEASNVKETLSSIGVNATVLDVGSHFANASTFIPNLYDVRRFFCEVGPLRITLNPEHKRQIFGNTFLKIVDIAVKKLNLDIEKCILVQGTLRPDLIESASPSISKTATVIKTHHNDTHSVRVLRDKNRILEPLKDLHKDEVRAIAAKIGLPPSVRQRLPFPGPGLSIRIIASDGPHNLGLEGKFDVPLLAQFVANYAKRLSEGQTPATKLIQESLSPYELRQLVSATTENPSFIATLLPIMSVGIQGDSRSYKNAIALSTDQAAVDWSGLATIAKIIPKVCTTVNRVVFAFGGKIEHSIYQTTVTFLTPRTVDLLRQADTIVDTHMKQQDKASKVSQFPVILIPVHFDLAPYSFNPPMRHSLVLRPFMSQDFMTGVPAIPTVHIDESLVMLIKDDLLKLPTISRVLYDLTSKPPATTEWE